MNDRDAGILTEMLAHCNSIEDRIREFQIDEELFVSNSAYADMLLMPLFQIGELVTLLSDEYIASQNAIPWHAIRAFRNIIAHDYAVVDSLWVWNTVQVDIPMLQDFLLQETKSF